jgi:hypothetical protein
VDGGRDREGLVSEGRYWLSEDDLEVAETENFEISVELIDIVVVVDKSQTSPTPLLFVSSWFKLQAPLLEQPITQSPLLLQVEPALSEPGMQVPSKEPFGLLGQLS